MAPATKMKRVSPTAKLRAQVDALLRISNRQNVTIEVLKADKAELVATLQIILDRSEGRLYNTDQVTGETFDAIARAAIAQAML